MEWLLWGALAVGIGLLALGVYFFNPARRAERAAFPLDDSLRSSPDSDPFADPLTPPTDKPSPARAPQSHSAFDELGVGPVKVRPLDETTAATLASTIKRRAPRFNYEAGTRREPSLDTPIDAATATSPSRHGNTMSNHAPTQAQIDPQMGIWPTDDAEAVPTPAPTPATPVTNRPQAVAHENNAPSPTQAPDVIPVYLIARQADGFSGHVLREQFARYNFEFGEMDVYHHTDAHGQIVFSLMNGVAPGTFDPQTLPTLSTPALALFLRLPITRQPDLVLEQFLDLAYHMADTLDATLLDDQREALSTESVDRMRAVIHDD